MARDRFDADGRKVKDALNRNEPKKREANDRIFLKSEFRLGSKVEKTKTLATTADE